MTLFNNIIVPLDGSESSAHALPAAQLMAGASGAKLTLVRCFPEIPEWQADASRGRRRGSMADAEHRRVGAYLAGQRLRLERQGFPSTVEIEAREGPAHDIIAGVANRNPHSLIAMSTHGQGGWGRLMSGSVTSRVLGAVRNPAFVVRCNDLDCPVVPPSFDNIIVPLDGTELGESALQYAGELASTFDARITLLRSIPDAAHFYYAHADWSFFGGPSFSHNDVQDMAGEAEADSAKYLDGAANTLSSSFPGIQVGKLSSNANAAKAIVDLSQRLDNSMVVMATRGRRGLRRMLLGSVADQVVRNSPVPTLLVKSSSGNGHADQ